MGVAVGVARADDSQLVGMFADAREEVGDQETAFAARTELAERRREEADLAAARVDELLPFWQWLAGVLLQFRLVVERINLAGSAIHHQEDDVLRFGRELLRLRRKWIGRAGLSGRRSRH